MKNSWKNKPGIVVGSRASHWVQRCVVNLTELPSPCLPGFLQTYSFGRMSGLPCCACFFVLVSIPEVRPQSRSEEREGTGASGKSMLVALASLQAGANEKQKAEFCLHCLVSISLANLLNALIYARTWSILQNIQIFFSSFRVCNIIIWFCRQVSTLTVYDSSPLWL